MQSFESACSCKKSFSLALYEPVNSLGRGRAPSPVDTPLRQVTLHASFANSQLVTSQDILMNRGRSLAIEQPYYSMLHKCSVSKYDTALLDRRLLSSELSHLVPDRREDEPSFKTIWTNGQKMAARSYLMTTNVMLRRFFIRFILITIQQMRMDWWSWRNLNQRIGYWNNQYFEMEQKMLKSGQQSDVIWNDLKNLSRHRHAQCDIQNIRKTSNLNIAYRSMILKMTFETPEKV